MGKSPSEDSHVRDHPSTLAPSLADFGGLTTGRAIDGFIQGFEDCQAKMKELILDVDFSNLQPRD